MIIWLQCNYLMINNDPLVKQHINFITGKYFAYTLSLLANIFISASFWAISTPWNQQKICYRKYGISHFLSPFSPSMFFRVVRYFRSNSSNISWGCLFIRRKKFSPLPLQAIQFNSVRVDSIRRVVWLNSFRDKSGEKRTREERGRQALEITGARQGAGLSSLLLSRSARQRAS